MRWDLDWPRAQMIIRAAPAAQEQMDLKPSESQHGHCAAPDPSTRGTSAPTPWATAHNVNTFITHFHSLAQVKPGHGKKSTVHAGKKKQLGCNMKAQSMLVTILTCCGCFWHKKMQRRICSVQIQIKAVQHEHCYDFIFNVFALRRLWILCMKSQGSGVLYISYSWYFLAFFPSTSLTAISVHILENTTFKAFLTNFSVCNSSETTAVETDNIWGKS